MSSSHLSKVLIAFVGVLLLACQNPKAVRVTEQNKGTFLEQMKDLKGLTVEEAGLLQAAVLQAGVAEALGKKENPLVGKTVGEIIADQRAIAEKTAREEAEQARLAAEAKAKADALAEQLRGALQLTVFDKGFLPSDYTRNRYQDYITIKVAYENKSGKNIRAFTGSIQFTDLFGKEIFESGLTVSDPVAAGARSTWEGTIEYNQFRDQHQALRNASLADMKVVWKPSQILFEDGTSVGGDK